MSALVVSSVTVKDGASANVTAGTASDGTRQLPMVAVLGADGANFLPAGVPSKPISIAIADPTSGNQAQIAAFHNADNQTLGTVYGLLTGGVDQLVNGAGNLDRKRGVSGDGMAVTGLAAEVPMVWNGATYDRVRSVAGDAQPATGIIGESVMLWNGTTYDRLKGDATNGAFVQVKTQIGAANLANAQVTCDTTAGGVTIAASRATRRSITITNLGTTAVYIGAGSVSTSNGGLLPGVVGASITLNVTGAIKGIVAAGSQAVSVLEEYD